MGILQMMSVLPAWHDMAAKIGQSLGLLAHRSWSSLIEWMNSGKLEQLQQSVPLRYIYGEHSGKPHDKTHEILQHHPDAMAVMIPGATHFMLHDRPDQTIAAIRNFLGKYTTSVKLPICKDFGGA